MGLLEDFLMENAPGERARLQKVTQAEMLRRHPERGGAVGTWDEPLGATGEWTPEPERPRWGMEPGAGAPVPVPGGARALPRATGAGGGATQAAAAAGGAATAAGGAAPVDKLEQARIDALAEQEKLMAAPDRTAAMDAYQKQALGGQRQLALAMMAGEAGMAPFQAQHLKQAAAAREPMKMAGGTMTETGFIEDPAYQQEIKLKRADMRVKAADRALELAQSAAEKRAAAAEKFESDRQLRQMMIDSQNFIASQSLAERRAAREDKAGEKAGKSTEGEKASAGYLGRMQASEGVLATEGKSGQEGPITALMGHEGTGAYLRPLTESKGQQRYRAAQEDWVRAKLRKESGASIPAAEMEREIRTYFPQPFEDPSVSDQKAQARAQAVEQMRTTAGSVQPTIAAPVGGGASAAPPVGTVQGGYTFKGGNPADPKNWSK
jgi:hypothetical protein